MVMCCEYRSSGKVVIVVGGGQCVSEVRWTCTHTHTHTHTDGCFHNVCIQSV